MKLLFLTGDHTSITIPLYFKVPFTHRNITVENPTLTAVMPARITLKISGNPSASSNLKFRNIQLVSNANVHSSTRIESPSLRKYKFQIQKRKEILPATIVTSFLSLCI